MHPRTPLRALTFDAAGTLIGIAEPLGETYARIAADFGARIGAADLEAGFKVEFPRMPPMAFATADDAERLRCERHWWRTLVERVIRRAGGVADFEPYFDALFAHYADAAAWRAFPDALPAMHRARERGLRVAVISNFDARLEPILADLGLADAADALIYSTACGAAKPDARLFHHALALLDVAAGSTLHVGDNLEADYRGARAAGLRALHLDRRGRPAPEGVTAIETLAALDDHFD